MYQRITFKRMWQQNETCYILEGVRRNCNMFHLFALSADDNYSITVTLYGWCPPSKMVSNGSKGTKFNDMSIQILAFTVQKYVNSHPTPGPHCANSKLLLKEIRHLYVCIINSSSSSLSWWWIARIPLCHQQTSQALIGRRTSWELHCHHHHHHHHHYHHHHHWNHHRCNHHHHQNIRTGCRS